jgi:predicted DNA-binding transcriptional regulator AlpA
VPVENRRNRHVLGALKNKAERSGRPLEELKAQHNAQTGFDPSSLTLPDPFKLLDVKEAAAEVRLSLPAFWRQVRDGRLPKPLYPAPRCPRWVLGELRAALFATRCLPSEAMAARRKARVAIAGGASAAE